MSISDESRIVITGIGLTSPCGNSIEELRQNILNGMTGINSVDVPYMGKRPAGRCTINESLYQTKKNLMRGTRAGSLAVYAANQAVIDSKINWSEINKDRVSLYLGISDHGSVDLEREYLGYFERGVVDVNDWSPMLGFKLIANSPASEVSIQLKITGPHFTIGGACSASNLALIQGIQVLKSGDTDIALVGGVSESSIGFGSFACFLSQRILANHKDQTKASRPLDMNRNGIVLSEGACVYVLERLSDAKKRNANIIAEIVGYANVSDAQDILLPAIDSQLKCMQRALEKANLKSSEIDFINLHATGTIQGDIQEGTAVSKLFGDNPQVYTNATKGFLGHTMGASSLLEITANLPTFKDQIIHNSINVENLDPNCALTSFIYKENIKIDKPINYFMKNSFGMMGLNTSIILKNGEYI